MTKIKNQPEEQKLITWIGNTLDKLLQHRIKTLMVIGLIFCVALFALIKKFNNIDNSLPVWFSHDSIDYKTYQEFLSHFGHDRTLIIAFETPDAFSQESLTVVKNLSQELKKHRYVVDVLSLTETEQILTEDDSIEVKKLFSDIPNDPETLAQKRIWASQQNDVNGLLTNEKQNLSVVIVFINNPDNQDSNKQLLRELKEITTKFNTPEYPVHYGAVLANEATFNDLTLENQQQFLVVMMIVMFVVIFAFFRNIYIAILPLILMSICITITQALFFSFNDSLNVVTNMMAPILMAACIADTVHAILGYNEMREQGLDIKTALIKNTKEISIPCFFTALTTFAGFISFNVSPIVPNQQLGYFSAFGVMLAYILTLFFIPLLISLFAKKDLNAKKVLRDEITQKLLAVSFRFVNKYRTQVLFIFLVLTGISFWGISQINIETNSLKYFPKRNPQRITGEFLEKELSGVGGLEIMISGNNPDFPIATDPKFLQRIEEFAEVAMKNPIATKVLSYNDWIKRLNQAWHNNDPEFDTIPQTREEIAQLLLIAESANASRLAKYKTIDNNTVRITIKCHWQSSETLKSFSDQMIETANSFFADFPVKIKPTGQSYLWILLDHNLLRTEVLSFSVASLLVLVMMMAILKSIRGGFISLFPNILPIFMALGAMGFLKIHLNLATVMTAGVAIGITVDDSIHYLVRFKKMLVELKDYKLAIAETNKSIGTAVIFNSTILMCGFLVLCLSDFTPSLYFGAVTTLTLLLAIFCEILLMPVMLLLFKPFALPKE